MRRGYPVSNGPRGKGNVTPAMKGEPSAAQVLTELHDYYMAKSEEAKRNRVPLNDFAEALGKDRTYIAKLAKKMGIRPTKLSSNGTVMGFILKEEAKRIADYLAGAA